MPSVWPFKRRSVRHRTFGHLRPAREGRFLRAELPFAPTGRDVEVHISTDGDAPTAAQEKLYLQLAAHYPKVQKIALLALHQEYQKVTRAQPHLRWVEPKGPQDLAHLTPLGRIWLDDETGRRFVLSFDHTDDKDHEFHLFFKNWRLESVASER